MNQGKLDIEKLELFTNEEKKLIKSFVVPFPKVAKMPGHYLKASYLYSDAILSILKKTGTVRLHLCKGIFCMETHRRKEKKALSVRLLE